MEIRLFNRISSITSKLLDYNSNFSIVVIMDNNFYLIPSFGGTSKYMFSFYFNYFARLSPSKNFTDKSFALFLP